MDAPRLSVASPRDTRDDLYKVRDRLLAECWLYDEDQRMIDELWSSPLS